LYSLDISRLIELEQQSRYENEKIEKLTMENEALKTEQIKILEKHEFNMSEFKVKL